MIKHTLSEKLEKGLTTALLLAFLLNIKKVLNPNVLGGAFNEYLDISIYLFDGVFGLWLGYYILKHNIYILSIYRKMFHVEHRVKGPLLLIIAFILWQWIAVVQADHIPLAVRQALTMTEIGIFILVQLMKMFHVEQSSQNQEKGMFHVEHLTLDNSVPRGTRCFFHGGLLQTMTIFALFNAFIVFIQISTQHSIGLYYLGESFLQVGTSGVATISLFGEKILRGYGLFPHPNILAAFLGLSILVLLINRHVPRGTLTENKAEELFHVEHLVIAILGLALAMTFSRIGIALTLVAALIIVPRGTIWSQARLWIHTLFHVEHSDQGKTKKLFHVEHIGVILGAVLLILVFFTLSKSFSERELSLVEYAKISQFELFGNGVGSYGVQLYSQIESINEWSIQPVHNYFLLTYYELGVIGLLIITLLLIEAIIKRRHSTMFHVEQSRDTHTEEMFHVEHRKARELKESLGIGIFLMVFALGDHFFYTIPQGQFIFWFGILVTLSVPRGTFDSKSEG